jgi:hypothetical protein
MKENAENLLRELKKLQEENEEKKKNQKTTVVNIRYSTCDVYIGRGSVFGNPFSFTDSSHSVEFVENREEAIARYREYILKKPELLELLPSLKGKRLGCHCKPLPCHGDVLVELIEKS